MYPLLMCCMMYWCTHGTFSIMVCIVRVRIAAINFKNKQLLLEMISLPVSDFLNLMAMLPVNFHIIPT